MQATRTATRRVIAVRRRQYGTAMRTGGRCRRRASDESAGGREERNQAGGGGLAGSGQRAAGCGMRATRENQRGSSAGDGMVGMASWQRGISFVHDDGGPSSIRSSSGGGCGWTRLDEAAQRRTGLAALGRACASPSRPVRLLIPCPRGRWWRLRWLLLRARLCPVSPKQTRPVPRPPCG